MADNEMPTPAPEPAPENLMEDAELQAQTAPPFNIQAIGNPWMPNPVYDEAPIITPIKLSAAILLGKSLMDLLKMAPNNPAVRTMIGSHCRCHLPDELITTDTIVAWIEANVTEPPPVATPHPTLQPIDDRLHEIITRRPVANEERALSVEYVRDGSESGTCSYTCSFHESYREDISQARFEELAHEAEGFDDLMAKLEEEAEEAMNDNGGNREESDYDHEDHNCQDEQTEDSGMRNRNSVETVAGQLLGQMMRRMALEEDRDSFAEKFNL